ncbi:MULTISPECIES: DUF6292 family protein [Actinosynnema]|uniref:DUF6292 family protein n=1 Tax=Actinosynnema TaxID=40566 RepID=UPI0020A4C605|nr:DUF6292 family protein [Actinosynnema pretiosum]MCP2098423.1 hypothetical protein [Actinosynnema pretiosum]
MRRSRTPARPDLIKAAPARRDRPTGEDLPAPGRTAPQRPLQKRAVPAPRAFPGQTRPGNPQDVAGARRPTSPRKGTSPRDGGAHALAEALDDYVRAVAEAVEVPPDGTSSEVTDTATAYLALGCRSEAHPGRDLMLVWSAAHGWVVSVETSPDEEPVVLSRSTGDLVPPPEAVAALVADAVSERDVHDWTPLLLVGDADWSGLAERMRRRAGSR